MTIPYELYLRFLATKGFDDIAQVNAQLKALNLPEVSQEDLDRQWNLIHRSMPASIVSQIERKSYSSDFIRNMGVLGVADLWVNSKNKNQESLVKYVYGIHEDTWLRVCINALIMKNISLEEISRTLSSKFSIPLREDHLGLYSRFFFNTSQMTKASWKSYIRRFTGREAQVYFTALTESAEVLKTELELPAMVNISDSLQWLLTKSFLKARSYINVGTVEAGREAREWIDQVVKLTDKYEKHRSGDQHDFAKALQMEFDFVDEKFDTPDDDIAAELAEKSKPKEKKKE
jgi:hypothetical protein